MKFIRNEIIRLINNKGDLVLIDTKECNRHQLRNSSSCLGCRSILGCRKYVGIKEFLLFPPTDESRIDKFLQKIISASSYKELNKILDKIGKIK